MLGSLHTLSADAHRLQCKRTATWSVFSRNSAAMRLACTSSRWAAEPCRLWLTLTVASSGTHLAFWPPSATKNLLVACCAHQVSMLRASIFRLVKQICLRDVRSLSMLQQKGLCCVSTLLTARAQSTQWLTWQQMHLDLTQLRLQLYLW